MEKVYRLLPWLNMAQALTCLHMMTGTALSEDDLLQLCEQGQCAAYIHLKAGMIGPLNRVLPAGTGKYLVEIWNTQNVSSWVSKITPQGAQQVSNASMLIKAGSEATTELQMIGGIVAGSYTSTSGIHWLGDREFKGPILSFKEGHAHWSALVEMRDCTPLFKSADIQALAAKMNGTTEHATEVKDMLQQLEQERAAREAAEAELLKRRHEDGSRTLDNMRHALMHDHKEFAAMQDRAEQAEQMVAALDKQLTEQAEQRQLDDKVFEEMARQLRELQAGQQPAPKQDAPAAGLVFPYATKHLEAMRDAAKEYWEAHDRTKPAPYGIQKQVQNFLSGRTGENARKLAELAAAIKPDYLPKT